mmetsp:Transcript_84657/g.218199  ORF Transcript_84657/g.218199 Transcript_84657/m.218199 type:complete len:224 (-) Transcript_84657:429-1100(-)
MCARAPYFGTPGPGAPARRRAAYMSSMSFMASCIWHVSFVGHVLQLWPHAMVASPSTCFLIFGFSACHSASSDSAVTPVKSAPFMRSSAAFASQLPAPSRETSVVSSCSVAEAPSTFPPSHGAAQGGLSTARPRSFATSLKRVRKSCGTSAASREGPSCAQVLKSTAKLFSTSLLLPSSLRRSVSKASSPRGPSATFSIRALACSIFHGRASIAPCCSSGIAS